MHRKQSLSRCIDDWLSRVFASLAERSKDGLLQKYTDKAHRIPKKKKGPRGVRLDISILTRPCFHRMSLAFKYLPSRIEIVSALKPLPHHHPKKAIIEFKPRTFRSPSNWPLSLLPANNKSWIFSSHLYREESRCYFTNGQE